MVVRDEEYRLRYRLYLDGMRNGVRWTEEVDQAIKKENGFKEEDGTVFHFLNEILESILKSFFEYGILDSRVFPVDAVVGRMAGGKTAMSAGKMAQAPARMGKMDQTPALSVYASSSKSQEPKVAYTNAWQAPTTINAPTNKYGECAICRHSLYLSAVRCECSPAKMACLRHAKEVCACRLLFHR